MGLTGNSLGYTVKLLHYSKCMAPWMFHWLFSVCVCFFCYWSRGISEIFLYHSDSPNVLLTEVNQVITDWQSYSVAWTEFCLNPVPFLYHTCHLLCALLQADFIDQLWFLLLKNKHSTTPYYEDKINAAMHTKAHFRNKYGWVLNSKGQKLFPS